MKKYMTMLTIKETTECPLSMHINWFKKQQINNNNFAEVRYDVRNMVPSLLWCELWYNHKILFILTSEMMTKQKNKIKQKQYSTLHWLYDFLITNPFLIVYYFLFSSVMVIWGKMTDSFNGIWVSNK